MLGKRPETLNATADTDTDLTHQSTTSVIKKNILYPMNLKVAIIKTRVYLKAFNGSSKTKTLGEHWSNVTENLFLSFH